jgi:hypothetical protein
VKLRSNRRVQILTQQFKLQADKKSKELSSFENAVFAQATELISIGFHRSSVEVIYSQNKV